MRVKMLQSITGTRDGVDWPRAGGQLDVSDDEGAHLCAAGLAQPVAEPERPERAVAEPPEKRAERPRRKKGDD